jgi:hypothetical protein
MASVHQDRVAWVSAPIPSVRAADASRQIHHLVARHSVDSTVQSSILTLLLPIADPETYRLKAVAPGVCSAPVLSEASTIQSAGSELPSQTLAFRLVGDVPTTRNS